MTDGDTGVFFSPSNCPLIARRRLQLVWKNGRYYQEAEHRALRRKATLRSQKLIACAPSDPMLGLPFFPGQQRPTCTAAFPPFTLRPFL